MSTPPCSPAGILQLATGHWAAATLSTAATYSIFTHIDRGNVSPESVAQQAGLSVRGTRALLDALVGLGLLRHADGRYVNSDEAAAFLVEGKPASLAGFARLALRDMAEGWARLAETVKAGGPPGSGAPDVAENPFWETLVPAIAPLSIPSAETAVERLGFARAGAATVLDVGGGSGIFAATLLRANPKATATQVDWANVNRIARGFVGKMGVGDRFRTVDGDFHKVDFGVSAYDVAIYSHIAHQESPASNGVMFRKIRAALKPAGTLVVNDFVVDDDRRGPPFALLFQVTMLQATREGATYRQAEYRAWLKEAGFASVTVEKTPGAATLVIARNG